MGPVKQFETQPSGQAGSSPSHPEGLRLFLWLEGMMQAQVMTESQRDPLLEATVPNWEWQNVDETLEESKAEWARLVEYVDAQDVAP